MGQLLRTICDRHERSNGEMVDTDLPTFRISVDSSAKEYRRDIEEELCKECVDELLTFLTSYMDAGRRPGAASRPRRASSAADNPEPNGGGTEPGIARRRPMTLPTPIDPKTKKPYVDDFGAVIDNAGPYKCAAPGQEGCIRHVVGFSTKQGRTSHERMTHSWNRNQTSKKPTIEDPSPDEIEKMLAEAAS